VGTDVTVFRRRSSIAVCSIAVVAVAAMSAGAASALSSKAKGVKGDPQPELAAFKIGSAVGPGGTVAVESNGNLVVAYTLPGTAADVSVCVLARAGHSCTYHPTLKPLSGDTGEGTPQVFAPSAGHVVVLVGAGATHGNLVFTSTNGGKTFGAGVQVGNSLVPTSAALVAGQIIYSESDDSSGVELSAVSASAPANPGTPAKISTTGGTVAVGSYKSGVLVAGDNASSGPTKVWYAPAGMNFNDKTAYTNVATISGESVFGMSGNALLTVQTGGKEKLEVRFFNGTTFGAPHAVPGGAGGGPEWFTIDKDPGGVTHVFLSDDRTSPVYKLLEVSTTTGSHWTAPTELGNGTSSDNFYAALDKHGSGLVLGVAPARGYPVLAHQSVSFAFTKSHVKKGHKTVGKGKAHAAAKGRTIELQVERSGRWYDVKSTHEKSNGSFSFTIKATRAGKVTYRAVAADHAGYVEFGYSSAHALHVKK
jgi:hypothetical protein